MGLTKERITPEVNETAISPQRIKAEVVEADSECEVLDFLESTPGDLEVQYRNLDDRRMLAAHAAYDAKPPDVIKEEAGALGVLDWSLLVNRLSPPAKQRVDHNITAMNILALFPGVKRGE